jgi:prophage regulatory protein
MHVDHIIRRPELLRLTGLSSASLYRAIKEGRFPRPVRLGLNSVGWRASAVQEWNENLKDAGPEPEPMAPGARR